LTTEQHQLQANKQGECRITFPRGRKPIELGPDPRSGITVTMPPRVMAIYVAPDRCPVCLVTAEMGAALRREQAAVQTLQARLNAYEWNPDPRKHAYDCPVYRGSGPCACTYPPVCQGCRTAHPVGSDCPAFNEGSAT
jgi:hypothetical protein